MGSPLAPQTLEERGQGITIAFEAEELFHSLTPPRTGALAAPTSPYNLKPPSTTYFTHEEPPEALRLTGYNCRSLRAQDGPNM